MRITTVDELVAHLKAEGVNFILGPDGHIRTFDRVTDLPLRFGAVGVSCCPLAAALPEGHRTNFQPYRDALVHYGMPEGVAASVMVSADNAGDDTGYDPAIRAKLLELVG